MKEIGRKQFLRFAAATFMAMLLMVPTTSWAQNKPWAKLADGVLTFTYGPKPAGAKASMKCAKCGKILAKADKFCSNCGTEKPKQNVHVFAVPLARKSNEKLPWGDYHYDIKQVVIDPSFKQVTNILSTVGWFAWLSNITSIVGLENLRTDNVKDMLAMFRCSNITSLNLSKFNTSKVTNMSLMFADCSSLTSLDLSNFDTSKVTNMSNMFDGCHSLTSLKITNFNTSKVTDMSDMFKGCKSLTSLNLSNFNTSNVTTMNSMFYACERLSSLDLSKFNTSKLTDMRCMFNSCERFTSLNLSNFDTRNVTDMSGMFGNCSSLKTITVSSTTWDSQKADTNNMFWNTSAKIVKK